MKNLGKVLIGLALVLVLLAIAAVVVYRLADRGYQREMDLVRKAHCNEIIALLDEFEVKTGAFPFHELTEEEPFMVLVGRGVEHEDFMANEPVLAKGARFVNAKDLEAELSRALGRAVQLPRDPQKVATFAPNVYVYFISRSQITVAVHLFEPSDRSVPYEWGGGTFHSHSSTKELP